MKMKRLADKKRENCTIIVFPGNNPPKIHKDEALGSTLDEASQPAELDDEIMEGNNYSSCHSFKAQDQGEYLGHCQPKKGTGCSLATEVLNHLHKYEADISNLNTVLTDGT